MTEPTSLADPAMLDKIDKLFECNVGHHIDLPQLVVVGDQSSGKSSVLEGLTDLPFPRDSGLCTRFATQITFRRSTEKRISVHILPAKGSDPDHVERLRAWSKRDLPSLDQKSFGDIMQEVHAVMGIGQSEGSASAKTFSEDILSLEVCGPDQQHLSVIDVPGIFKKTTQGVTTKTDMQMVHSMVESYVRNPRSVIMAVIPANVDTATQSILDMAADHDPEGSRTLGVLTKPDLVDGGAENRVMDLLEGRAHQLTLGWCMVRNLGQRESEDKSDRHLIERNFFREKAPWNRLDKNRVGVEALQMRLREILGTLTRREFPKVRAELSKLLKDKKAALEALGPKRDAPDEQAGYLTTIASRFQELSSSAVSASYWADDIFDQNPVLKIATLIVNRNELFSTQLQAFGHEYEFDSKDTGRDDLTVGVIGISLEDDRKIRSRETSVMSSHPEIEDILFASRELATPKSHGVFPWLTQVYKNSRGFELGTFDPALLTATMKAQSEKWKDLAFGYISDVITMIHEFVVTMIRVVCPDERIWSGLVSILMEHLVNGYEKALDQAKFILQVERSRTPMTLNHYFNDNLEKCRQQRMKEAMEPKSIDVNGYGTIVKLSDMVQNHPMSNTEHVVQDMHDILRSYYKVARKRFVDNVCMQAADHHLLSGPQTPLKILSPMFVRSMTSSQLKEVAGEDMGITRKREELDRTMKDLEMGRKILM